MSQLQKKIEVVANIAIIAVAIMIGSTLYYQYFVAKKAASDIQLPIGSKLSLPDVDWTKNGNTIIIALKEGCRYCTESAPFYQKLVSQASTKKIPIVIVLPQSSEVSQNYLKALNIQSESIRQVAFHSIGIQGTPTILLVNNRGEVIAGWLGKLSPDMENELLAKLI